VNDVIVSGPLENGALMGWWRENGEAVYGVLVDAEAMAMELPVYTERRLYAGKDRRICANEA